MAPPATTVVPCDRSRFVPRPATTSIRSTDLPDEDHWLSTARLQDEANAIEDRLTHDNALWRAIMSDDTVDEVSATFKDGRTLLKWRYAGGPYYHHWFVF